MHSQIRPNAWAILRLPSEQLKVLQVEPNTLINLGKYGAFPSNLIIGRPYHLTYELLDRIQGHRGSDLRIVPASEIHADTIAEENTASRSTDDDDVILGDNGVEFKLVGENGEVIMRSNRETIDDSARQTLTMAEIEELKREGAGAGKDLIAKLMLAHTGIEEKTSFSLAKYKLLKTKKYLRQFTVLPMDVSMVTNWMIQEKDSSKIQEMRDEMLALLGCWANVHYSEQFLTTDPVNLAPKGRWLVVDDTGGLLVAALAERMGILFHDEKDDDEEATSSNDTNNKKKSLHTLPREISTSNSNTITLVHHNAQPNLFLMKYFDFSPDNPSPDHPLTSHLSTLTWLQLISPEQDSTYSAPIPSCTDEELVAMKSSRRGNYYRKRRRWQRITNIVNTTRMGSFDGLAIASSMDPVSILRHTVPLLQGGAPIAIYSSTIEPLTHLADLYSTSRRTAFIQSPPPEISTLSSAEIPYWLGNVDFPLNPTLLLSATVQTSRIRQWQVLPGRTHPLMTGRGGSEGYLFTATRVIPAEGRVEARGKFKKRKVDTDGIVETGDGAADSISPLQNGPELLRDSDGNLLSTEEAAGVRADMNNINVEDYLIDL